MTVVRRRPKKPVETGRTVKELHKNHRRRSRDAPTDV